MSLDYCISRKFEASHIEWVKDECNESKFPAYEDLPSEVYDWPVRGYPSWEEIEWEAACIEQIQDAYGYGISYADVKKCENEQ